MSTLTTPNMGNTELKCILKLLFDQPLYDEMTDISIAFPDRALEFNDLINVASSMKPAPVMEDN